MEFLGVRVVRGPDWEWNDQDGGEGSVGTVFQIGSDTKSPITEPIVLVQWDCGIKANYRAGMDGKYDLRILDTANGGERHLFTSCDGCQREHIIGSRWHCKKCPTYDLCTQCYMTDCHDNGHAFERIDRSRGKGYTIDSGSWIFKGAKVIRGPDGEVNDQISELNKVGVVEEVVSSNDEDTKDSVRVSWKKGGPTYIYRVGKDGKVDLKCTVPAIGGNYYRDHLPSLVLKQKKSQGGLTTGDKVIVEVTLKRHKKLSSGHGEWNRDMAKYMREIGVVQDFTSNDDVVVEYADKRWRYNPEVLKKVQQIKRGDEILVKTDKNLVKELQVGHGEWNEAMVSILGRYGKVLNVDGNGDLLVLIEGNVYYLNPAAVAYFMFHQIMRSILQQNVAADIGNQEVLVACCRLNALPRIDAMVDGRTALHVACQHGHCDIIRELIDRGADKDKLLSVLNFTCNAQDNKGYTATHHAAIGDKTGEALKLLLSQGFDPNVQDRDKRFSPLHLAVHNSNEMAVRILTQYAACDVNLQDQNGDTPLHCAIAGKENNMVDMLLGSPGLMATTTNCKGFNYLHVAALKGNKPALEKLLEMTGSSLSVATDNGFTTLHIAAVNGYREIAEILLEQPGCSVNAVAIENQTPLHLAALRGYPDMAEVLLDHGADVNAAKDDGDTPLHLSLKMELIFKYHMLDSLTLLGLEGRRSGGEAAVSRCLLRYGTDVQRRNNSGETPLDICRGTEVEQVIRDFAAKGNSNATEVPIFEGVTGHPGIAHQGENDSEEVDKHVEPFDHHSDDRETNDSKTNDEVGHGQTIGETVDDAQEKQGTQDDEQSQDVLVQNCIPLIENVVIEAANKVLDPSLEGISNKNLNTTGVAKNNDVVPGAENADPAEQKEAEREKLTCRICEESEAVVAFKPCGHIILCSDGNPLISVNSQSLVTKYRKLEEKLRLLEESSQCCICTERKKNVVFQCGHGTCQYCAYRLETCHMCLKEITRKIQTF
ncbi:E3 ubiquitin-protein ligase MIB2 [Acropora cervicornis]|uniref:RING-type E3 ubiquitin transferase n=1 Tax=Acropora cervicornis TaxID=6130 RepID=A0AAD9QF70_ACRCE|nr:E3 ubiquitin-protein ligase MIB2 [Acropora cervicornis]